MSGRWFGCGWAEDGVVTPWRPGGMVRALLRGLAPTPEASPAAADLLRLAEAMAAHSGQSVATISNKATGGGRFFKDIDAGKGCTIRTFRRVMVWFSTHWPADLPWPADIPRPNLDAEERAP